MEKEERLCSYKNSLEFALVHLPYIYIRIYATVSLCAVDESDTVRVSVIGADVWKTSM